MLKDAENRETKKVSAHYAEMKDGEKLSSLVNSTLRQATAPLKDGCILLLVTATPPPSAGLTNSVGILRRLGKYSDRAPCATSKPRAVLAQSQLTTDANLRWLNRFSQNTGLDGMDQGRTEK